MKTRHLEAELKFYDQAFSDNATRRKRQISWGYTPSQTVVDLVDANGLAIGAEKKKALDLGMGDGRHIAYLLGKGFNVVGIDFSGEAVKLCEERFQNEEKVHFERIDLTENGAISHLGQFDLVLDWSVLDHIRREYMAAYLDNLRGAIKEGGNLLAAEFDITVRRLYRGKDFKCRNGHYSRGFSLSGLIELLSPLKAVDYREKVLEDEITGYKFNTVLMANAGGQYGSE